MAQIINPTPTFAENLGAGLGHGLQAGVQTLLEQKLKAMAQEQQANRFMQSLSGLQKSGLIKEDFTPEALQALKNTPESLQPTLLKQLLQAPQQQAFAKAIQSAMGGEGAEADLQGGGLTGEQAATVANLQLKKQKQIAASQEKVKPFLDAHYADVRNAKLIRQKAQSALDILKKHRKKFPKGLMSYAPESFFRDPDVRKYAADLNTLVKLSSASTKGAVTNLKIKLEQLAKANLNQPLETQEAILNDFISAADSVDLETAEIERLRKENKGIYPEDISQKMSLFESGKSQQNIPQQQQIKSGSSVASVSADKRPIGTKAINSKTKEAFYWDGQDWVTEKEWEQQNANK